MPTIRSSKKEIKKSKCPQGQHFVQGYWRKSQKGKKSWVKPHCAKNPSSAGTRAKYLWEYPVNEDTLTSREIDSIFKKNLNKTYLPLNDVKGFEGKNQYDQMIIFWIKYWESRDLTFPKDFTPLMVKILIAIESSFNPKAKSKAKNSTALGLMQITKTAIHVLSGKPDKYGHKEVKKCLINIQYDELIDPVVNIAVGIRWLHHKYSSCSIKEKDSENMFKAYRSKKEGDLYAKKILSIYKESK